MAIILPAVGETGTAEWADSVANQLNATPVSVNGASNVPTTSAGNKFQSGTFTLTWSGSPTSAALTVTFPTAFATTPVVTFGAWTITGNTVISLGLTAVSATAFTVIGRIDSGATFSSSTGPFQYIAIGT